MIYSTGIDIIEIERIERVYRQYREKFMNKIFSADEREAISQKKSGRIATLSGKFAAKEAVMKSLGSFFSDGVYLRDIEVLNLDSGQPYIRLPKRLTDALKNKKILISISHEKKFAVATAIISDETPTNGVL